MIDLVDCLTYESSDREIVGSISKMYDIIELKSSSSSFFKRYIKNQSKTIASFYNTQLTKIKLIFLNLRRHMLIRTHTKL